MYLTTKRLFTLMINKIFIQVPKLRGKWVHAQSAHHLAKIVCFISYKKWMGEVIKDFNI